jgi:integrase/recombinase XerD
MIEQPSLFDPNQFSVAKEAEKKETPEAPRRKNSLAETMPYFEEYMVLQGFTAHTIESFLGDMGLVMEHLGAATKLGEIRTRHLNDFLTWLSEERNAPCSPKSYARRVTTLKVFFGWLHKEGVLSTDPAAQVVQLKARSPLPDILYDDQIDEVLTVTRQLMAGDKKDPRPHLLVTLILSTGIKKGECMRIELGHIDLSNPRTPILFVRYEKPRYRLKERKLKLPREFVGTLRRYRQEYEPQDKLFTCTARNLEYVLHDVAQQANLPKGLSFEMLRWTCAVRDFRNGMDPDRLRRKLGLSPITWRDSLEKIRQLAEPAL